jgi:hypothetical protein
MIQRVDNPRFYTSGWGAPAYEGFWERVILPFPRIRAIRKTMIPDGLGGWVAYDASPYTIHEDGTVSGAFPWGPLQIGYETGYDVPPSQIKAAALQVLIADLLPSNLPSNALQWESNGNLYKLSVANGENRFYGIPAVDSALAQHRYRKIG